MQMGGDVILSSFMCNSPQPSYLAIINNEDLLIKILIAEIIVNNTHFIRIDSSKLYIL